MKGLTLETIHRIAQVWQELFRIKRFEVSLLRGFMQRNHSSAQYVTGTSPHIKVEIHRRFDIEEKPKCDMNFCLSNNAI